ncbi:DUF4041 domain-containing protein [Corticicoccus populi]|uniref:DUF4041 domain-containing protein n=1 Tax=Corticicoccus populi TaxID=1812821 RepID=A0ABW5WTV1_9STAP
MVDEKVFVINKLLHEGNTLIQLSKSDFLIIDSKLNVIIYNVIKKKKEESYSYRIVNEFSLMNVIEVKKFKSLSTTKYLIDDLDSVSISNSKECQKFESILDKESIKIITTSKKKSNLTKQSLIWSLAGLLLLNAFHPLFVFISLCLVIYILIQTRTIDKKYLANFERLHDVKESINRLVDKKQLLITENDRLTARLNNYEEEKMRELSKTKDEYEQYVEKIKDSIKNKEKELQEINNNLLDANLKLEFKDVMVENTDHITSVKIKDELSLLTLQEKELLNDGAVIIERNHEMSKKEINDQKKQIIRSFNTECDYYLSNVTANNLDTYKNRVVRAFETLNRIYKVDSVQLSMSLLKLKLKRLNLVYKYAVKVQEEKELQKAAREQLLEEQKVQREIDKEMKIIEKEEKHFNREITKLMKYLNKSNVDIEKELYLEKIKELEGKLKHLEEDKKDVENRAANTRAGYVYIISNIGSFGEDIYKIGVTRRLEPMDRVKELGDASVPFEFDVHAMIFSDDAPKLESTLHQHFRSREVNKMNHRKEFFKVSIEEIEEVVTKNHNDTVEFVKVPVAFQYRESMQLVV